MRRYLVGAAFLLSCGGISTKSPEGNDTPSTPVGHAGSGGGALGSSQGGSGSTIAGSATAGSATITAGRATGGNASSAGGSVGGSSSSGGFSAGGTQGGSPASGGSEPVSCSGPPKPIALECRGIKTASFCQAEGAECSCLACGLADMGLRRCRCFMQIWSCSACQFPPDFRVPDDAPICNGQADKLPCNQLGQMCQGAPGGEVCACYPDDEGVLLWDCDKAPITTIP